MNEFYRGRRLRRNPVIREMVRETQLSAADLMMLYFVVDTTDEDFKKEIPSMPGQYQLSVRHPQAQGRHRQRSLCPERHRAARHPYA